MTGVFFVSSFLIYNNCCAPRRCSVDDAVVDIVGAVVPFHLFPVPLLLIFYIITTVVERLFLPMPVKLLSSPRQAFFVLVVSFVVCRSYLL